MAAFSNQPSLLPVPGWDWDGGTRYYRYDVVRHSGAAWFLGGSTSVGETPGLTDVWTQLGWLSDFVLPDVGAVGSFGDASHVAAVRVDAKGRVVSATAVLVQIAISQVSGLAEALSALAAAGVPVDGLTVHYNGSGHLEVIGAPASGISGTLGSGHGGTGLSSLGAPDQVLGVTSGGGALEYKTITGTSNQVSVLPSSGALKLGLPQDIGPGSSPAFTGLSLSGLGASRFVKSNGARGLVSADIGAADIVGLKGITSWGSSVAYATGDIVVASDGNYYRAIAASTGVDPTLDGLVGWELFKVVAGLTLAVDGKRFAKSGAGIQAAISFVRKAIIDPGVVVTVQLSDGTYTCPTFINCNMVCGAQVQILGNTTTPSNVTLNFGSGALGGINVGGNAGSGQQLGYTLGRIDALKIVGTWTNTVGDPHQIGICVINGSRALIGPKVSVDKCYYGVYAARNSFVFSNGVSVTNSGDAAYFAYQHSYIDASGSSAVGAIDSASNLGSGYCSEQGAYIDATACTATACKVAGFNCINGRMRVYASTSNSNSGIGFRAIAGSYFEAGGSMTANSNGSDGIYIADGSGFANYLGAALSVVGNSGNGLNVSGGSQITVFALTSSKNGASGVRLYGGSRAFVPSAVVGGSGSGNATGLDVFQSIADLGGAGSVTYNNSVGVLAQLGGYVLATGVSVANNSGGNFSPAVNSSGNQNSYIRQ